MLLKRAMLALTLLLVVHPIAFATWSILAPSVPM